jgi:SHS2 domain-containing protein
VYRWLERESEVELLVEDDSPEAVFTEALVAIGELISEERGGESVTHEVRAAANDLTGLLAKWIAELVRLAETDGFIPERVVRIELFDATISATVGGQRSLPRNLVKDVSYERLELEELEGEWRARVILDT